MSSSNRFNIEIAEEKNKFSNNIQQQFQMDDA